MASRRLFVDIAPLRDSRDFRLLWLSQLATSAGRQIVVVAVPYQLYLLTHSSWSVGLLALFQAVLIVDPCSYGGDVADRSDLLGLNLTGCGRVGHCTRQPGLVAFWGSLPA